ncbi:MAG: C40 family peptidase [Candidatus Nanopelagicales bacterium]|nr:C40 family peptidase [Candidatus Nanopelagicales bacterium]MDZ4249989.1 C40 family peptidase [Candidatus Nanopelagicales bacterium]
MLKRRFAAAACAVAVAVAGTQVVPAAPAAALADPATAAEARIVRGDIAVIAVAVATLWKAPRLHRRIDRPSLTNPVDLVAWNRNLRTASQRRWLVSRVQTQALYGQEVLVREVRGRWARVAVLDEPDPQDPRGYPGWLPIRQLATGFDADGAYTVVTRKRATLRLDSGRLRVSFGTRLPVTGEDASWIDVRTPDGPGRIRARAAGPPPAATRSAILRTGRQFLGLRYLWGGLSAWGFDCSGLIWDLFRAHGMTIPRDADPQFRSGRRVSLRRLKPADLLFWGTRKYVHHVALYVGRGKMLEAPNSAGAVQIVKVRRAGLVGARRYLTR